MSIGVRPPTNGATGGDRGASEVSALAAIVADLKAAEDGRALAAIHRLNGVMLRARSLDEVARLVELLPAEALSSILRVAVDGEAHTYVALNLLHFVCFAAGPRSILLGLRPGLVPRLVGMLRARGGGGAEHELRRAALSLLVSLAQGIDGAAEVGAARGVTAVVASQMDSGDADCCSLALDLVRAFLRSKEGRAQAIAGSKLDATLARAAASAEAQEPGDVPSLKALNALRREIQLYAPRA